MSNINLSDVIIERGNALSFTPEIKTVDAVDALNALQFLRGVYYTAEDASINAAFDTLRDFLSTMARSSACYARPEMWSNMGAFLESTKNESYMDMKKLAASIRMSKETVISTPTVQSRLAVQMEYADVPAIMVVPADRKLPFVNGRPTAFWMLRSDSASSINRGAKYMASDGVEVAAPYGIRFIDEFAANRFRKTVSKNAYLESVIAHTKDEWNMSFFATSTRYRIAYNSEFGYVYLPHNDSQLGFHTDIRLAHMFESEKHAREALEKLGGGTQYLLR